MASENLCEMKNPHSQITRICLTLAVLLCVFAPAAISARTLHVSPQGLDSNSGSESSPFREIRKAIAVIIPGDTVLVADGTYKGFDVGNVGSVSAVTTIRAIGTAAVVTPTTDRGVNNPHNIMIWQSTQVVVEGLRTFQAPTAGMRIVQSNNITVRNGVFGNNGKWGILTSHCNDLLLENNECYGSVLEHGIYVANSGDRPVVRGNRIHGNTNSGLRANGDINQGGDGIISGAIFENNIIFDNGVSGGAAMNFDGLQDGIIRNNLIYGNRATGIALFKGGGAAGPKGMQVLNNTIIVMAGGRYCLRITDVVGPLVVRNNILYNLNTAKGPFSWNTPSDAAFTDSDWNAFGGGQYVSTDGEASRITMTAWRVAGHEPHSIVSTTLAALFAASADDYQLAPNSPAINRGTALPGVTHDLLGIPRPQGEGTDIGAYVYANYASWKTAHGITANTPPDADEDCDGVPLLLEYSLGLSTSDNDSASLPTVSTANGLLQLAYQALRQDVLYIVEASADLKTWTSNGVSQKNTGAQILASVPIVSGACCFLRLQVTLLQ